MVTSHLTRLSRLCLLVALATLLFNFGAQAQNCSATLSAENQKNIGTANENGASFTLNLTNKSSASTSYTFTATFLDTSCATPNKSNLGRNVELDVKFFDRSNNQSRAAIQGKALSAGQSGSFVVDLQVPDGTAVNRWSCVEINAIDMNCGTVAAKQLLRVFVADNSDE